MARKVDRTRDDAFEEGYDLQGGSAGASLISPPLTAKELAAYRKELREKDERRKPVGFAPWPKDTEKPTGSAVSAPKAIVGKSGARSSTRSRQR